MNKKILLLGCLISSLVYGGEKTTEIKLDDTVVTSVTGFETSIRKVMANPTVVTSKEIKEKGYKTVSEILKDIPAVNVIGNTFGSIVDLRGQGGLDSTSSGAKANVQVMIDGVAVNALETSMVSSPINTIAVNNIERIEIIPGGGSVLYGSGTAGGVINIITKRGEGLRGNGGYNFSTLGSHKTDVSFGQSIGKFDIDLSYNQNEGNGYRKDSKLDSDYFQGKLRYNINDDHNLEFKYNNYNENKNLLDSLTKAQIDEDRKQGNSDKYMDTMDIDKEDFQLTYNGKLSENLSANVITFRSETDMLMSMPGESSMRPGSPLTPYKITWNFKDKKTGIKPKLKYAYGDDSSLIFGLDYIKNDGGRYGKNQIQGMPMSISMGNMDLNKETLAGFIMNNYKIGDFEFNQGFRYENSDYEVSRYGSKFSKNTSYTKDENNYAYELGGSYRYSDIGRTYLRYERGFTTPAPALLTNKWNKQYNLNNLESETYHNIEWGISDYIGNTSINFALFYSLMNDEIYTNMQGGMGDFDSTILNYNIDKTQRMGAELKLEQYFGKLTLSESYQYINAKIKEGRGQAFDTSGNVIDTGDISGNKIAGVPEHRLTLGARYDFTPKFNINGEVVYNGESYLDNNNETGKKDSYIVTNVRFNYNADNGLSLFAGINNIFNEDYYESISYSGGEYLYDPAPERNYYIGFSYTL
ncbi:MULTISPECIES: TonB-dependent receptor [Fusobacterium]|uniref:TonB-dependent receptor n=1 Tax=Fusobacterium TaxID=848 RepID=UPI001476BAE2|nr:MULTISPECIES: TonB-dependent receptor [Fusobacterium]NME36064.1 TonB-dependent receptor [Fusobacterium sp. FSA-380-WT-3A]